MLLLSVENLQVPQYSNQVKLVRDWNEIGQNQ